MHFRQESELGEVQLALDQECSHFVVMPYQLGSQRSSCHFRLFFHFRNDKY
jgi:hypothetical protein